MEGFDDLIRTLGKLGDESDAAVDRAQDSAMFDAANVGKVLIYPHIVSGNCQKSIRRERRHPRTKRPCLAVGGAAFLVDYAHYLEAMYPYAVPAVKFVIPTILPRIGKELQEVARR